MNSPVSFGKLVAATTISVLLVLFIGYFLFVQIAVYLDRGRGVPSGTYGESKPIGGVKVN